MPLDTTAIGRELEKATLHVDAGRLRYFAKAIGETNPVFTDADAAVRAGYPGLVVPPTFLFSIALEAADPFVFLTDLGIDLRTLLHGSQKFTYYGLTHAGDDLTVVPTVTDIYAKKGGLLEFVEVKSLVYNQHDAKVAEMENVYVVQNSVAGGDHE